ncbi:MAG: cytochrome C [Desulfobulbaceae bacterium]|nr:cytochrome C [Desulfobulbaceae bacterium]MDP2106378.1 cytochrome c3 family protein [Desulfobulbaceae bacterium]
MKQLSDKLPARLKRYAFNGRIILVIGLFLALTGCFKMDPLAKHKVLTSLFDGVPELPPVEELCKDNIEDLFNKYYEQRITAAETGDFTGTDADKAQTGSKHRPWAEKNCISCHNFQADNKLKLPTNEICSLCHKNLIQGKNVHGPVAVGACLACHDPHTSGNPSLLKKSLATICFKCHKEKRLADDMHNKIVSHNMLCVDCHNPHSGNLHYFLK